MSMPGLPGARGHRTLWDRYGRILSACCAVHCFLMPLALLLLPLGWGRWVGHPGLHLSVVALSLFVAAWAYGRGARLHGRSWVLGLAVAAAAAVLGAELFLEDAPWWHAGVSGLAGLALAWGHHLNLRYCAAVHCDCPSHAAPAHPQRRMKEKAP